MYYQRTTRSKWLGPTLLALIVVTTFVGGAIMTLLSPAQISKRLSTYLDAAQLSTSVHFSNVQLRYFNNFFPRLGLQIDEVEVKPKDSCKKGVRWKATNIYLPLSWRSLLSGKFRGLVAQVDHLDLFLLNPNCTAMKNQHDGYARPAVTATVVTSNDRQKTYFDREQVRVWLSGLRVLELNWHPSESSAPVMSVQKFYANWHNPKTPIKTSMRLYPQGEWALLGEVPIEIAINAQVAEDKVQLSLDSAVGEGSVTGQGQWEFASDQVQLGLKIKTFSAAKVFAIAKKVKIITDNVEPKRTWFSCEINMQGQVKKQEQAKFAISHCLIEGDIGRLEFSPVELKPWSESEKVSPFKVHFSKVSLSQVLQAVGREGPSGMLSRFGEIDGELDFTSRDQYHIQGELKNLEVAFSNRSVRGKQTIDSLRGAIHLENGRLSGLVDMMQIPGGKFAGLISFNVDSAFREGVFQMKVDQLQFNSDVQNLMAGGSHEPLAIYGQGRLLNGEIVQWAGDFGSLAVQAPQWSIKEIKMRSRYENNQLTAQTRVKEVVIKPTHNIYPKLKSILNFKSENDDIVLTQGLTELKIMRDQGSWQKAMIRFQDKILSTSGDWQRGQGLRGWVEVEDTKKKISKWQLKGDFLDPQLSQ